MVDLQRPIAELVAGIKAGEYTAVELVQASLNAIKANHDNAILEINPDALNRAKELDSNPKEGGSKRLWGIPFIAKDNFLTKSTHTTAASNILKPFKAPYQATVIERLEAEGAVMVAKANMDAFAHGSSTENSDFGPTKNTIDPEKVPGGSSGGSAAAVAAGLASFALGTDTGGSIRQPAAFCGVVGLKPTYGLVSRYGVVAMGSSVDVIGPIANRVEDAALVLDCIAGRDDMDATTIQRQPRYSGSTNKNVEDLRIGLIREYLGEGVDRSVKQQIIAATQKLKVAGATVTEVSLPAVDLALAAYYILVPAEISSNLSRYDGIRFGHSSKEAQNLTETYLKSRDEGFGKEAKRRIMIGTYVLSSGYYDAYYKHAQKARTLIINEFNRAFKKFDLLIGPTTPTTAFKLGEKAHDPLAMYVQDVATVAVNLAGVCAISLPAGDVGGLPVGLQIIAPQRADEALLGAAAKIEELIA